jgi:hypothetical protein
MVNFDWEKLIGMADPNQQMIGPSQRMTRPPNETKLLIDNFSAQPAPSSMGGIAGGINPGGMTGVGAHTDYGNVPSGMSPSAFAIFNAAKGAAGTGTNFATGANMPGNMPNNGGMRVSYPSPINRPQPNNTMGSPSYQSQFWNAAKAPSQPKYTPQQINFGAPIQSATNAAGGNPNSLWNKVIGGNNGANGYANGGLLGGQVGSVGNVVTGNGKKDDYVNILTGGVSGLAKKLFGW